MAGTAGGNGNLWSATAGAAVDTSPLTQDLTVDLVVVGGGFTGLSAALHAAEQGASVCLLEAEEIGHGGSGRNVGLVNAGLWLPPGDVAKIMGERPGARLNAVLAGGPDMVFDLIARHDIACEAVRNGTLHCAHAASGMRDLERRHAQLTQIGAPVSLLSAEDARARTGSPAVHGALFDPRAGTVQPKAYARGLARAAMTAGARIVQGQPAGKRQSTGDRWIVEAGGHKITARALIEATNAYGQTPGRFTPMHYFQMATAPLPEDLLKDILPGLEGCWDTALVMSSFRRDAAGRVIVGGIGALDHAASGVHGAWARRKLGRLFPQLAGQPLEHAWHGRIASTADHLPKIERFGVRGYAAYGYSGRGIGTGTLFGKVLAQAALSAEEAALPLVPVPAYAEKMTGARALYYESGAVTMHGLELAGLKR
ncbi:NAD(P)/FAD-dependent oxidoreductase [Pseudooceanicola nanhaiensis]|uniref:NAD(P)/FAD-dependent oxidoreductase n=1 Tax=Pseudooceanicola nanhaiensis TaxID=375761 RepID=UPI001CD2F19E|nr:FAD-dependent oxidoreductase [Pseudooceanicola nanhaiensis]MCA0922148.1 FAD-binding oxidoreductase [Pseudooceanicola nanhaiensis]